MATFSLILIYKMKNLVTFSIAFFFSINIAYWFDLNEEIKKRELNNTQITNYTEEINEDYIYEEINQENVEYLEYSNLNSAQETNLNLENIDVLPETWPTSYILILLSLMLTWWLILKKKLKK